MRGDDTSKDLGASAAQLVKLAREELGEMSTRQRVEGFVELSARRLRRMQRKPFFLKLSAVLAVVALAVIGYRFIGPRDVAVLSYAVEGGRIDSTGALEAVGAAEPTLRFSDGTEVVFRSGARGRVKSVEQRGARIAVTGKVDVKVVHWRGSHWLFDAGPFLITVTGTAFTVEWRDGDGS
jgi:hypothetical protein